MNRMPPPEGPHAPPGTHPSYEPSWRPPYPPSFDPHPADARRPSSTQAPIPSYSVMPGRELPGLSPDGPTGVPMVSNRTRPYIPRKIQLPLMPINGAPHEASPEYRPRMSYPPADQISSAEHTPSAGPLPPASQFMTPGPSMAPATPVGGYDPNYYQNQAYGARQRKAARAQQACDQCRARKAKCDEGRPGCSHCKENNLTCVYKEVPPHKQEKSTQLLIDRITHLEDTLVQKIDLLTAGTHGHDQLLREWLQHSKPTTSWPGKDRSHLPPIPPAPVQEPVLKQEPPTPSMLSSNGMAVLDPGSQDVGTSHYGQKLGPVEVFEDAKNDQEGELSIPVEHTTAAHKLLMWPSIKKLLYPEVYDEDYVMRLEEERGLISVYGQGEISYTADDSQLPGSTGMRDGGVNGAQPDGDGAGVDSDVDIDKFGNLNLDVATAQRYYQSYMNHMYKLHPFIDQGELDQKVESFIRCYCRLTPSPMPRNTQMGNEGPRPAKRKRSNENLGARGEFLSPSSTPARPRVGRNIDNAVVMLCLALGAICECPAPLPGPIMDQKIDYRSQHIPSPLPPMPVGSGQFGVNGVLSPANSDSALQMATPLYTVPMQATSQSFGPTSTTTAEPRRNLSRRSVSHTRDEAGHTKNYQVIPGLTLYGFCTEILGHLQGANELEHVQAALLAGLYAGQLAHPFQSHSWISQASRACQVLVRTKRYERLGEGAVLDLYNFAYWTCLQLESDLLAELDIPASGISRSESRMTLPKGRFTLPLPDDHDDPATAVMLHYSAQIHLRKVLNRVHTDLYKVEKQGQRRWSSTVQEALSMNLDLWRTSLPVSMLWRDSDPPSNEINAARMRAKYYGARYIIHRPLLYHALHYGHTGARIGPIGQTTKVDSPTSTQQMSPSMLHSNRAPNMSRMSSDMGSSSSLGHTWVPPKVALRDLPAKLRRACKVCIDSAILSTEAFDGVGGHRLVVTNIFGTAHAQFGNMLVLSATYMSSLRELVDTEILDRLLRRTICFLAQNENISPTLRADARILTEIYHKIFDKEPDLRNLPPGINVNYR
ncbi:hypothetical protein N7444_001404 [Penicillium canescens]|nr:hypothetical protein N7444_001404 [Penicillium canescens]